MSAIQKLLGKALDNVNATVEIYTWQTCPYCIRAKLLLWMKGVEFTEYKIDGDEDARTAMAERANGRRTVPQIFINDNHIGGCDDLYALNRSKNLDPLLQQAAG
ncbi:MAG: glutaredoxin 3 [Synechococcus sp.]